MILAGDVGGTKTVLALFEAADGRLLERHTASYASREHASLETIVGEFLRSQPQARPQAACFGVAGAVIDGRCHTTNLPWKFDEPTLGRLIGIRRVRLLNDLQAAAYGMLFLPPEELQVLNPGIRRAGSIAVIAAGTGLGEGILAWDGHRHHPIASEGGHTDFAPRSEQEIALLRHLREQHGARISTERVLSGPGLQAIYKFLRDTGGEPEPPWLAEQLRSDDPSAAIANAARAGTHPPCVAALELFVSIYGAEAGNLALKCFAIGGVFLGGGIAPKILPALNNAAFMAAFTDKGRFADLMRSIPVRVALNPRAPILGAARFAAES